MLKCLRLSLFAATVLLFSSSGSAQEQPGGAVAGQETIAGVNDLWEAIDLLYDAPITEAELQELYLTMASLTAWARVNQYEWKGMTESYPTLEAMRGFTYWEKIGRSPEPFTTTFAKIALLSNNAHPDFDARERAQEYINHHEKLLADGEVAEEEMEMALNGIATAKEHLLQLNSIPEANRELYVNNLSKMDSMLKTFDDMHLLSKQPEIAFQSNTEGLLMRSGGVWSRSHTDLKPIFTLADFHCYVGIYSVPWYENDTLDDALIDEIVTALTDKDLSLKAGARLAGEIDGRTDYRLDFQVDGEYPRGMIYATAVEDALRILIFRFTAEEEDLLKPILDECCINLEFGDFEPPLLLDRSEVGYQIFAEAPWMVSDVSPSFVDHALHFGQLPIFVDLGITEEVSFGLERFIEVIPNLTDSLRKEFLIPAMKEPRMIEVDGLPCAVIQGSGIMLEGPEAFVGAVQVKQNYYILNGDRIIHISTMGDQDSWSEVGPIIENLVLNMKIARIAPTLGPIPVLLNQSEDGFIVYSRDSWNTFQDEASEVWGLSHQDEPLNLYFFVHKDIESVSEQMPISVQNAQQGDALWFDDPTLSEISETVIDGRTSTSYEIHGILKAKYAAYPDEAEHFLSLFIPQDHQILRILISGKHDSWEKSRSLAFKLIENIQFHTPGSNIVTYDVETSLLVDRAEVGYQVYANGLWKLEEETAENLDSSFFSEALGCYVSVTVVAGNIPPEDLAGNLENFHKTYLSEFVEPHSVNSEIIEIDGQRCAISEAYGVKAEGTGYAGIDIHERHIFLPRENHVVHFSIRTTTGNWETAAPHIEDLINNLKFSE